MTRTARLDQALSDWRAALGDEAVLAGDDVEARFIRATTSIRRRVPAVVRLRSPAQVAQAMGVARRHRIAVYPVSTGRNWGYGCATPITDGCVIFDLSGMNRILAIDAELGL